MSFESDPLRARRGGRVRPSGCRSFSPARSKGAAAVSAAWIAVTLLIAASSIAADPASAEVNSRQGEVLLGTFATGREGGGAPAGSQQSTRSRENDAHRLLEDAREDLASGHVDAARKQLQDIVRRYPETESGREAELYLGRIDGKGSLRAGRDGSRDAERSRRSDRSQQDGAERREREAAPRRGSAREDRRGAEARRVQLERDLRMSTGDRIFFSDRSSELGAKARMVLASQAAWMMRNPDAIMIIEGHADDAGSAEVNLQMARDRAEAVRQRLIDEGVPSERLRTAVIGRERRVANCSEPACMAQNRRAVATVAPLIVAGRETERAPRLGYDARR